MSVTLIKLGGTMSVDLVNSIELSQAGTAAQDQTPFFFNANIEAIGRSAKHLNDFGNGGLWGLMNVIKNNALIAGFDWSSFLMYDRLIK